jgi:hypothetical protein
MTRIIRRREDALPGEEVLELRVLAPRQGDVRGAVVPMDFIGDHTIIEAMSEPIKQAYADALDLCRKEEIPTLWVHDPKGAFPTSLAAVKGK